MITREEVIKLRDELGDLKDTCIKAKATYAEIVSNIDTLKKEIKDLGFDPDNVEEEVKNLEKEIQEKYDNARKNMEKIKEEMGET